MPSNIQVQSNLMVDDEDHHPQHRYLPGDFLALVYPDKIDTRVFERELSPQQRVELFQYLRCRRCGKPCAGTCESAQP